MSKTVNELRAEKHEPEKRRNAQLMG